MGTYQTTLHNGKVQHIIGKISTFFTTCEEFQNMKLSKQKNFRDLKFI